MTADRLPPSDLPAERALLSGVLVDSDVLPRVSPIVRPESFYSEAHRRIFEAAESLASVGQPVDIVTVATWLKDRGRLDQVGGVGYLTETLAAAPIASNPEAYAEIIASKHRVRRMIAVAQRIVAEGYEPIADEDAFVDRSESSIHEVAIAQSARTMAETMRATLRRVFTKLHESAGRVGHGYTGVPTGFTEFDEGTGGLHDGETTVIAARPAMGKTGWAMNIASNVAARELGVIVFSLEMPNEQLATRALCSAARVNVLKARTNNFDRYDWSKLTAVVDEIAKPEHFYLVDRPCTLLDMRSIARAKQSDMARSGTKLALVVVDYIQLMQGRDGIKSREEAVSDNARGLKMLSKELGCHVILLSQLNRGVESRNDKRPLLSDMKESGAIEESADCVVGMYRDDYYNENSKTPGIVELVLLKQKHGPTGTVSIGFEASSVTFTNLRQMPEDRAAQ